jgi:hypothetical protein
VTGNGEPVTGTWLGEQTRQGGAPIPSQIADKLRGKRFSDFDKLREAIWEEVATDPTLNKQFSGSNLTLMKGGRAPHPPKADQQGGRKTFEIHHKTEVSKGGAVYAIPNMVILTPKQHIKHHSGDGQ